MTTQTDQGFIAAPEPGGRLSAELGEGMPTSNVEMVETPTYVYLWNRDTRERSVFPLHMARHKLKEKFTWDHPRQAEGFAWTNSQPSEPPQQGITTCPLHPDRPERSDYDKQGYPICNTATLPNEGDALRHLQRKHKNTYELIEKVNEKELRQEERDSSKNIQERLLVLLEGGKVPLTKELVVESDEPSIWEFENNEVISIGTDPNPIVDSATDLFIGTEAQSITVVEPNPDVYHCKKCGKNHRHGSGIARRHLKHKRD